MKVSDYAAVLNEAYNQTTGGIEDDGILLAFKTGKCRGDTLAEFIAKELVDDVTDYSSPDDPVDFPQSCQRLRAAIGQLQACLDATYDAWIAEVAKGA